MRFHTSILQGRIKFMTRSSLLISKVNCWPGILSIQKPLGHDASQKNLPKPTRHDAQHFNQLPFHQIVVQLLLPSRHHKRSILKSHQKNI